MGYLKLAFISYDPFKDQRIDPKNHTGIYGHPDLPGRIHDAVRRAKHILGEVGGDELKEMAAQLDKWRLAFHVLSRNLEKMEAAGRDYTHAGDSDILVAYLEHHRDDIPVEEWPRYMSVFVLAMAGCIVNLLWPDEKVPNELKNLSPEAIRTEVMDHAFEAVNAIGIAQGFQLSLYEIRSRAARAKGGAQSNREKGRAFRRFAEWVVLPQNNQRFKSLAEAIRSYKFMLETEQPEELVLLSAENVNKSLSRYLRTLCEERGLSHPFR